MDYKQFVQSFQDEVINGRCYDKFLDYCHEDFTYKSNEENCIFGFEAFRDQMEQYFDAFPNLTFQTINMFQDGNCIIQYWCAKGKHNYNNSRIPGKPIKFHGFSLFRFKGRKIYENYVCYNEYDILKQLGIFQNV
ncbi:ester cyclase [Pseudalkalibacillus sp. SCS-8]|uniref:ester cyclase n=1 Tax=Pseudalkalibacillus nanhaiensis TaxID=3115291 RepID=UPI0032DA1A61